MDNASTATIGRLEEILDAYQDFLESFENVFDYDWDVTESNIKRGDMIFGTFLNPECGDESDNWANRGYLLSAYRELRKLVGPPSVTR